LTCRIVINVVARFEQTGNLVWPRKQASGRALPTSAMGPEADMCTYSITSSARASIDGAVAAFAAWIGGVP
jgi:hypothetical protein